jgi:hypothetical protein
LREKKKVTGPMDSRQNLQVSLYKLSKATTVRENAACIDHVKGTAENMKNMDCIYIYIYIYISCSRIHPFCQRLKGAGIATYNAGGRGHFCPEKWEACQVTVAT